MSEFFEGISGQEGQILLFIQEHIRNPILHPFMMGITRMGDYGLLWIFLTICLLYFKKTRRMGIASAIALVLSLLATNLWLKPMVGRVRPYVLIEGLECIVPLEREASFPSGHSSAAFASAVAVLMADRKKLGKICLGVAFLMALSRLYVGVHYPTDVAGGIIVGSIAGIAGYYISLLVLKIWEKKKPKKRTYTRKKKKASNKSNSNKSNSNKNNSNNSSAKKKTANKKTTKKKTAKKKSTKKKPIKKKSTKKK